jgi:branched-chain amino acid transport system permease protein
LLAVPYRQVPRRREGEDALFTQQVVNGLTIGLLYALVALGYTMIFGILGFINFAHGDVYMVGAFLALTLVSTAGLGIGAAIVASVVLTAAAGVAIELVAYRPLRRRSGEDFLTPLLVSTIGVSIFLETLAVIIWGSKSRPMNFDIGKTMYMIGDIYLSEKQILVSVIALVLMIGLTLFVKRTVTGMAMRAVAQDMNTARLMGINVNRIVSVTFAIGSALAATAGILVGSYYNSVYAFMGYSVGIKAFTAAILGGIGSLPGAVLASVIIGVSETLGAAYISSTFRDGFAFIILILTLIVLPSGLASLGHGRNSG